MNTDDTSSLSFRLHDAEIVSIGIDREHSVCRIDFSHHDGKRGLVEFFGVLACRAEDFILQNVVSRTLRSTAKDFSMEDLDYWVAWATSLSDASSWLKAESKNEWMAALNDSKLELVVFEPSAGAQIAVICERMTITVV
jgi:hypothetical protein